MLFKIPERSWWNILFEIDIKHGRMLGRTEWGRGHHGCEVLAPHGRCRQGQSLDIV